MYSVLSRLKWLTLAAATLILAACSTELPQQANSDPTEPDFVATVDIESSANKADIEALYGGNAILFEPEDGFAVLGFSSQEAELTTLATEENQKIFGTPESQSEGIVDDNHQGRNGSDEKFEPKGLSTQGASAWAGGASAWAGGASAWAGGASAWAGGASAWAGGTGSTEGSRETAEKSGSTTGWSGGYTPYDGGVPTWEGDTQTYSPQDNHRYWQQIGLYDAHAQLAKDFGDKVIVAVVDTGIDDTHPAFVGRLVPGFDFVDNDNDPQEKEGTNYGHGTAVAGIIIQVAPLAKIMPLRALDGNGAGDTDDIAKAINYAIDHGAQIINLSLGSFTTAQPIQKVLAKAQNHGVLVVTSAGNTGDRKVTFPAREAMSNPAFSHTLVSVGSVSYLDNKSTFSTYGAEMVEMVAPGEFIFTAQPENQVAYWSGTSFAAPIVTGSIALALGQHNLDSAPKHLSKGVADKADSKLYTFVENAAFMGELGNGRLELRNYLPSVLK